MRWVSFGFAVLFAAASLRAEPEPAPSAAPASALVGERAAGARSAGSGGSTGAAGAAGAAGASDDAAASAEAAAPPTSSAPSAEVAPAPSPSPPASALAPAPEEPVQPKPPPKPDAVARLGDITVLSFRVPGDGKSPEERARAAIKELNSAVDDPKGLEVRVERRRDRALIYAGATLVTQLFEEDAIAAGDSSLEVHAATAASSARRAITSARQQKSVSQTVFSLSLAVFLALIALFLMRRFGQVADRARVWLEENGDRVLSIRVQRIELITPAMLKSSALVALSLFKWFGQFAIFYTWLVAVLWRFDATRGYTQRLTGLTLSPASQFMERLAGALPILAVAAVAALAVFVLVRFVGLFFAAVARRETALSWLPPDLAHPTGVLLRIAIVITALVFAAPVVTGDSEGSLSRAGMVALFAIGFSATPLIATGLIGMVMLYGRRLRVDEHVEYAGELGRVSSINLFEVRLATAEGTEIRLPHLLLLRTPLRGLGRRPRIAAEIAVSADTLPSTALRVLDQAASRVGREARIELQAADADGLSYRVSVVCESLDARTVLTVALLEALAAASIPLGRSRFTTRSG